MLIQQYKRRGEDPSLVPSRARANAQTPSGGWVAPDGVCALARARLGTRLIRSYVRPLQSRDIFVTFKQVFKYMHEDLCSVVMTVLARTWSQHQNVVGSLVERPSSTRRWRRSDCFERSRYTCYTYNHKLQHTRDTIA